MPPIIDVLSTPALVPFLPSLGWPELMIILAIVLVIFGPKKLPDIGKAIGQSIRELKKSSAPKEEEKEEKKEP